MGQAVEEWGSVEAFTNAGPILVYELLQIQSCRCRTGATQEYKLRWLRLT